MTVPRFRNKYDKSSIVYPKLLHERKLFSLDKLTPDTIFLCFSNSLFDVIVNKYKTSKIKGLYGDLRLFKEFDKKIGILGKFGVGGPVTAVLLENLAYWGVKKVISLGMGSSLQEKVKIGEILVVEKALRDEGTSYHYQEASPYAHGSEDLRRSIEKKLETNNINFKSGSIWTTDAIYRETKEEVIEYQNDNLLAVDMETASFYTVGKHCNVLCLSILGISDSLATFTWEYTENLNHLNNKMLNVFNLILEFLHNE